MWRAMYYYRLERQERHIRAMTSTCPSTGFKGVLQAGYIKNFTFVAQSHKLPSF